MKMRITKLVEVAVEVPERCPHCGASFTDARSPKLREVNVEQTTRFIGSAFSDGDVAHLDVLPLDGKLHIREAAPEQPLLAPANPQPPDDRPVGTKATV